MSDLKALLFQHFLTFELWSEAKKLLDFQIAQRPKNKFFNTFNFYYFEKIKNNIKRVSGKKYFDERIKTNVFYGMENEFFFHKYTVPKKGIGLRQYFFFSYPMAVLYYAVGIYILKISSQFIKDNNKSNIRSYYGGNLNFKSSNSVELILKKKTIQYYNYYRAFKNVLKSEIVKPKNKVVIRLDIQNYFDNISISNLLNLIFNFAKPSELKINNFDRTTIELIEFYFKFLNNGKDCLPQSDNNIISGFIGYLYLLFGDLLIEDRINEIIKKSKYKILDDFKVIRYVDDIYISLKFKDKKSSDSEKILDERDNFIYRLLNEISDGFYNRLKLRFNSKACIYRINKEKDRKSLRRFIKRVSEEYPEPDDDNQLSTPAKVKSIISILKEIKDGDIDKIYKEEDEINSVKETLKDIYDENVLKIIEKRKNTRADLEKIFKNFNFNFFRIDPQPLVLLCASIPKAKSIFEKHILEKKKLTTFDRGLIINYLCHTEFKNKNLIEKLRDDIQFKPILKRFKKKVVINNSKTGYFNISFKKLKIFIKEISLIEQIRMRVYAERADQYSVSLNHLLNEIQLICCLIDNKNIKKYRAKDVDLFLSSRAVPNDIKIKIVNLFDRRNNNPIVHPGSDTKVAWAVSREEYFEYKKSVERVLSFII